MNVVGNSMLAWSYDYGWIPIVGTLVEWNGYVAKGDKAMTALYGVLSLAEVLSVGGVSRATTTGKVVIGAGVREAATKTASTAAKSSIQRTKDDIVEWLGSDFRFVRNSNDDVVLLSSDNTKRVRFDLNHPAQHEYPHMHVEELVDGAWEKSGPIFPSDSPFWTKG